MTSSAIERAVQAVGPERFLGSLTTQEQQALAYQWRLWARPSQLLVEVMEDAHSAKS